MKYLKDYIQQSLFQGIYENMDVKINNKSFCNDMNFLLPKKYQSFEAVIAYNYVKQELIEKI